VTYKSIISMLDYLSLPDGKNSTCFNPFWHDLVIDDSRTKGSESMPACRALQTK